MTEAPHPRPQVNHGAVPPHGEEPADGSPRAPGGERVKLKGNLKRSVYRERSEDGTDRMVKVFHAPRLGRLRDRGRAAAEAKGMVEARRAGLPVADVLGTSKVGGAWCLSASWIEAATPLDEALRTRGPGAAAPGARLPLADALGSLLAACQAVGFVHGDPHPGNVLVDRHGKLWLVDLAGSRLGSPLTSVVDSIARAAGPLRETDGRFLVAVHGAWRRAAKERGLDQIPGAAAIDSAAQRHRLAATARRIRVWRRTSTPTTVSMEEGHSVVRVRPHEAPPGHWIIQRHGYGSGPESKRAWARLVRARLHRLPAALPVSTSLAPPWHVEFAVPPGTAATPGPPCRVLGALLHHRGLQVSGPLLQDAQGSTLIGPDSLLTEAPRP